jgi:hypothetical protein
MKYMIEYTVRTAGLTYDQNLANQAALLTAFGKWAPDDGMTIHAICGNDGQQRLCPRRGR